MGGERERERRGGQEQTFLHATRDPRTAFPGLYRRMRNVISGTDKCVFWYQGNILTPQLFVRMVTTQWEQTGSKPGTALRLRMRFYSHRLPGKGLMPWTAVETEAVDQVSLAVCLRACCATFGINIARRSGRSRPERRVWSLSKRIPRLLEEPAQHSFCGNR